jgi:hypothetical protein
MGCCTGAEAILSCQDSTEVFFSYEHHSSKLVLRAVDLFPAIPTIESAYCTSHHVYRANTVIGTN